MLMSVPQTRRLTDDRDGQTPFGIAIGIGAVAVVVAGVIAAMIPVAYPGWRFGVIAVTVAVFAAVSLDQWALAGVAVIGFLISDGFLEDRLGQLSWHGSADLWRLMLLVVVGAGGLAIGEAYRYVRNLRSASTDESTITEEETHGA
jgi:hypothetical protein